MLKRLFMAYHFALARAAKKLQYRIEHNIDYAPIATVETPLAKGAFVALQILQLERHGLPGLAIVAKSDGRLSRSSIYVVLGELEEQGLVRAKRVRRSGRVPRPIYSITSRGQRAVVDWELQQASTTGAHASLA